MDFQFVIIVLTIFLIGGLSKGVVGFGLPAIVLGLLTIFTTLPEAIALMLVSSFLTNVWQTFAGGRLKEALQATWPFMLAAFVFIWVGAPVLAIVSDIYLTMFLGALLVSYAALGLGGAKLDFSKGEKVWYGPAAGAMNGVITGLTGTSIIPGLLYLNAKGMERTVMIQAMGFLFGISSFGLALVLWQGGHWEKDVSTLSVIALTPALLGMWIGQKIRHNLSETLFRRIFFLALTALGIYLLTRPFV